MPVKVLDDMWRPQRPRKENEGHDGAEARRKAKAGLRGFEEIVQTCWKSFAGAQDDGLRDGDLDEGIRRFEKGRGNGYHRGVFGVNGRATGGRPMTSG